MSNLEVSNPGAMFAEELNIDIRFGSESENLVIANSTEGKKSSGTSVWPDSPHVS